MVIHTLKKSYLLIILFTTVALLSSLVFSQLIKTYNEFREIPDFNSTGYLDLHIQTLNENSDISIKDLKEIIFNINKENENKYDDILLYRNYPITEGKGVYFKGDSFKPNIISGRNFNQEDFINGTNTILVREELLDEAIKKGDGYYYTIGNFSYKVIGIMKNDKNTANPESKYYVNLFAKNENHATTIVGGFYSIDTSGNNDSYIVSLAKKLKKMDNIYVAQKPYSQSSMDILIKTLEREALGVLGVMLTVLLIFINIFNSSSYWVLKRIKEIGIRKMSGATNSNIFKLLFKEYLQVVSISYILGLVLIMICSPFNEIRYLNFDFNIYSMIFTYSFIIILGAITGFIVLKYNLRRQISRLVW